MDLDVVLLSRLQFALTIMFHYLFPPLTIGMGVVLVWLEARYLITKDVLYHEAGRFWTQVFALNFAVGVVTGIVMEFEFGTNWATYSRFVGDVFGSALAAEGIFAFFLESGFLAVLVFGWNRVGPRFHFFSTCMVALGSIFSAIWIVVANSWQQTPRGHHIVQMMRDGEPWFIDGEPVMRAEILDFWSMVFNPSTVDRLTHTLIGCFIMGAFFVMSISAFYLLRGRHLEFAKRSFTGALLLATISSLAALATGHSNAQMVAAEQPAKLAAFDGVFETGPSQGLSLMGWPDVEAREMAWEVEIPGLLSWLVHEDTEAVVLGLDAVPREYWPNVPLSYWSYHTMVILGMSFIGLTLLASFFRLRGTLYEQRWLLWIFVFAVGAAMIANQVGWTAAEVGRQPWVVHPRMVVDDAGDPVLTEAGQIQYRLEEGLLTSDGVSKAVTAEQVLASIIMFGVIYLLLGAVWVFVLNQKIQKGPVPVPIPEKHRGMLAAASGLVGHTDRMTGDGDALTTADVDRPGEG